MPTTEQLNSALAGRYEIERVVGQGGMATVYLARDLRHNRRVALKVLSPELAAVLGRERFLAEIEVTANLQHPHLLPLFDSGEVGGLLFYVMPFVEGESLRHRLERERQLTVDDAVFIATAVGGALDYAHRHGVIHRDLKPENILFHERDPLVMDFGIALAVSNAGGARVTQTGLSLGTPSYMSPEQATGDRKLDARSDIYSLGALTYEMLTGEPPHVGPTVQAIFAKVIADTPRNVRSLRASVPEHVDLAVMHALEKIPADRFSTAADFVSAISGAKVPALTGTRSPVVHVGEVRQLPITALAPPPVITRRSAGWGTAAVLVAAIAGAAGTLAMRNVAVQPAARFVVTSPDSLPFVNVLQRQVELSRDGSRAVFYFNRAFPATLYTRRTGELHFDAIPGTDSARSVVIGPDGKAILFWRPGLLATTTIMRIPIEGGAAVKIADSATAEGQASWGDGHQVLFRRRNHLVLVSDEGGPERAAFKPDTALHQRAFGFPHILPGGKAALITINHGTPQDAADSLFLGVLDLETGKVSDLAVRGLTPRFAAGHVLYVGQDEQLFARPFDLKARAFTGERRVIARDVAIRGTSAFGAAYSFGTTDLSVSETGMLLYTDGGSQVRPGDRGAGRSVVLRHMAGTGTNEWLKVPRRQYVDVRASPDGARLAMTITDSANAMRQDVWLLELATGQFQPFTRDGMSSRPVWSADGKRITFRVADPVGPKVNRFYSAPWDQSAPPVLVAGADGAESLELPGPQGKYIAYVLGDSTTPGAGTTNSDIFIAPVDSPQARIPFAASSIRERNPRFSPDGKWMAYTGHELSIAAGVTSADQAVLYVRPVPGPGGITQVSIEQGNNPLWSRDSKTLYYMPGGGGQPLTAARVSTAGGFSVIARDKGLPGIGQSLAPASSASRWLSDILPNGDIVYLTGDQPPALPAAAGAPPAAPFASHLIAIINWLGADQATRPPN